VLPAVVVVIALGAGCRPALDDRPWLITRPQIVGWKAEPPEAAPGGTVALQVVAVGPDGPLDTGGTTWRLCRTARPLDESRAVAVACLDPAPADALGDPVQMVIPSDACRLFGPDPAQPAAGAPPSRPVDADATGGYYQPVTLALAGALAVGRERVACGLPGASLAAARAFEAAYQPNRNPVIASLAFSVNGAAIDRSASPIALPATTTVDVEITWAAGSAETFALFDPGTSQVLSAAETLTVSWYVTGGELAGGAAAIADPGQLTSATAWTTPAGPATLEMVTLLRDSRGGSDAARTVLSVGAAR
jgi:hypothetical protein